MFADRRHAAQELAGKLARYKGRENAVILAIPRGGVVIGAVLARELGLPLDVILTKKIGHPSNPEYAIGVVNLGAELLDEEAVERYGISRFYIARQIEKIREQLRRRYRLYHGSRPETDLRGKTAIICDDGIATGSTMIAAIRLARREGAGRIVAAVPVGSPESVGALRGLADETVCVLEAEDFAAIGQFYEDFSQVEDAEAIRLLEQAEAFRAAT